jgi:hypothetical protein
MSRVARFHRNLLVFRAFMFYLCGEIWTQVAFEYDYATRRRYVYSSPSLSQQIPNDADSEATQVTGMSGWMYAYSLTREDVKRATPPGTVKLIGRWP